MPRPKNGKKPGDVFTTNQQKRTDPTDADRVKVLDAILAGRTLLEAGQAAGVDRWTAEGIAGRAGWSGNGDAAARARVQAARDWLLGVTV